jgi:type IV pilus assembly protein PilE
MGGRRIRGFTLLEVMIVVAIVGILAAIAYPSYQNYIKRSIRSATQSFMLDLGNREQQYLLDKRSYLGGSGAVTTLIAPLSIPIEISPYYDIAIAAPGGSPPTFTITATPKSGSTMAGDGNLTLDEAGTKAPSNKWEGR